MTTAALKAPAYHAPFAIHTNLLHCSLSAFIQAVDQLW